ANQGQKYEPVDHDLLLSYVEATDGQILEEGITEAGSMASFIAAGTAYATRGVQMMPFFTFYSMFGFQRVGDLIWQAADARTRGFLLAATAGRTTLSGEGLQHQDGHSLVLASTVPACLAYDPAFAYEIAVIIQSGLQRMYPATPPAEGTEVLDPDVFYYITLYNENYVMPSMPEGLDPADIVRGLYLWAPAASEATHRATLLFSGAIHGPAREAADILLADYGVAAELWSATSYKTLREEALTVERWNRLHPGETPRQSLVAQLLGDGQGPIVAVTDFMKIVPEQVARFIPNRLFVPLGTDGVGRSDTREALREFFEIDAASIVVAVLAALCAQGEIKPEVVSSAIERFGIDPESADPRNL
ncbi:MAG: pyruvate dehydrogenase (acetyl-transferring), homodimeric type, partial [Ilumatobacteraceae bacterium]